MLTPSIAIQGTKWISVAGFIPGAAGFTESGRQMARQQSETIQSTLLLPCSYFFPAVLSAFQLDVGLTLRSVLGGQFQSLLFLTNNVL